jgi:hypothetical protein
VITLAFLCADAQAMSLADAMAGRPGRVFDGPLMAANADEQLRPYMEQAESIKTDEEKAKAYCFLARVADSAIAAPSARHVVAELADKALSYGLSLEDKVEMLVRKGSAVQKEYGPTWGDALREPRRQVAAFWLEGYKAGLAYRQESELAFRRDHPDLSAKATLEEMRACISSGTSTPIYGPRFAGGIRESVRSISCCGSYGSSAPGV